MEPSEDLTLLAYEADQLRQQGRLREAFHIALEGIRAGVCESELFYVASRIALELGNAQKAWQLVNRLLAIDPGHINGWILFGRIHAARDDSVRVGYAKERSRELFSALYEHDLVCGNDDPEYPARPKTAKISDHDTYFNTLTFADLCVKQGHLTKALEIYRDLLEQDPANQDLRRTVEELTRKLSASDQAKN